MLRNVLRKPVCTFKTEILYLKKIIKNVVTFFCCGKNYKTARVIILLMSDKFVRKTSLISFDKSFLNNML